MRRRSILRLLSAMFCLANLCLAGPAAAQAKAALTCDTVLKSTAPALADLRALVAKRAPTSLLTRTYVIPGDGESSLFMHVPLSQGVSASTLAFGMFIEEPGSKGQPAKLIPINHLSAQTASPDLASKLHLQDTGDLFNLQVNLPDDGNWNPLAPSNQLWRERTVDALACTTDGAVVAFAQGDMFLSAWRPAQALSWLLVAVIYLFSASVVWHQRRSAARNQPPVEQPVRVFPVKEWSFWRCLDPVVLTSDDFDQGNLSKFQMFFFLLLVAFGVTQGVLRTGTLSDLSSTIVYLLGIPAVGTLGATLATNKRDRLSTGNWAWLVSQGILPINDPGVRMPKWSDLIMSEAELNIYKIQALAFSGIVGIAMVNFGFGDLASFSVPSTLLQILGLSQAVFVGDRWTKPTTMGDLDDLLTELRSRKQQLAAAAASGVDLGPDGKPAGDPKPDHPFADFAAASQASGVPNAANRYLETANQVKAMLDSLTHRDAHTDALLKPAL